MDGLQVLFCNNPGDWRDVSCEGYAAAHFKGWEVKPAAQVRQHSALGESVVVNRFKCAGEWWLILMNQFGESDTIPE